MTELVRFANDQTYGVWARIKMDNGDPIWISVSQAGVRVKKSKMGLFGALLYDEHDINSVVENGMELDRMYSFEDLTPEKMNNPVLKAFSNAVLHCHSAAEVCLVLNKRKYPPH